MAYPIVLSPKNQKVLVIGGDIVALRKAEKLWQEGFEIKVVATAFSWDAEMYFKQQGIDFVKKPVDEQDFSEVDLVFNTAGNEEVRRIIQRARGKHKFLLNDGCFPRDSDFHVPATYNRGALILSIYTHGMSPALGKRFRKHFEACFGEEWEAVLEVLGRERKKLLREEPSEERRREVLRSMVEIIPEAMFESGDLTLEERNGILENIQNAGKK